MNRELSEVRVNKRLICWTSIWVHKFDYFTNGNWLWI